MIRFWLTVCWLVMWVSGWTQPVEGVWSGLLTQDGKTDTFFYRIDIRTDGQDVYGTALSRSKDGDTEARFEIGGLWQNDVLTLQEVRQTAPPGSPWCLKHIRLIREGNRLDGTWQAQGCTPGKLHLTREVTPTTEETLPSIAGKWVGHLTQSDRDYGFYFELKLEEGGTGTSTIISDGAGGNATHRLQWSFDPVNESLELQESGVLEKSVADWPWCIKTARLEFSDGKNKQTLAGNWTGYLEEHDLTSGACAPGFLYLERPVFSTTTTDEKPARPEAFQLYEKDHSRKAEVTHVLEVKSRTVKVAVWDNGIVDGDVLSLFVNGEMILKDYRVSRRKQVTIVELNQPENYLILHAINLGSITPNTVAVSVDDGVEEQMVIMSSNLRESGAIMLREFTIQK